MHPFKERIQLAPKMIAQLNKAIKVLGKIQESGDEIDPLLLTEYEQEKEKYLDMDKRFKELSKSDDPENDRPEGGYPPSGGKRPPSKHGY